MKIEIACHSDDTTKDKGDLLEALASKLLNAQNYQVTKELRVTGAELDLLCTHNVSGKQIYVECKAQTAPVGAPILRQLNGTVDAYDYSEGWLFSTAEFGKEAKGFVTMWNSKPIEKSQRLSFYSPDDIIESLMRASVICRKPIEAAADFVGEEDRVGEWALLVSKFGWYWYAYVLSGGAPSSVILFSTRSGKIIKDIELLKNISTLDTSMSEYDIYFSISNSEKASKDIQIELPNVVEVQTGDAWMDYRPARAKDFIGRDRIQKDIFDFFDRARSNEDATRIFAITGSSGMGKSSLVAKVREKSRNKWNVKKNFVFAVDMRGARNPAYVSASLLRCLTDAQKAGFGDNIKISLSNPTTPLSSESVAKYLGSVKRDGKFICLVFDQFEELYSKPDLYGVFNAAKDLMLDVASFNGAIGLGFAWKTDATTHQEHPAYHVWHELSDHRKTLKLGVFAKGEVSNAITSFEKEVKQKLPAELRHQIAFSCQGYPWLLKKLCIHLFETTKSGKSADSTVLELDVASLFQSDIDNLSAGDLACLKIIAAKAPADWSEIIELSGIYSVNALVSKRLVVKSGDRLNIYWDIFRDFLLTGSAPVVPFNYVPSTDINSLVKVSAYLEKSAYQPASSLAKKADLKERTVWNIGADLVLFGVSERRSTEFRLHRDLSGAGPDDVLRQIRNKLGKHSLKINLYNKYVGQTVQKSIVLKELKECLPGANFSEKTWGIYANRFCNFLHRCGFSHPSGSRIIIRDSGSINLKFIKGKRRNEVFLPTCSPAVVVEMLRQAQTEEKLPELSGKGVRAAISILRRFDLIDIDGVMGKVNLFALVKAGSPQGAVWSAARNEEVMQRCVDLLKDTPDASGQEVGEHVATEFAFTWQSATKLRYGNSLRQWSRWIIDGTDVPDIPAPPGRVTKAAFGE